MGFRELIEADTPGLQRNLVVQIGDTYFSKAAPDSDPGGLILSAMQGTVDNVSLPGAQVDILKADVGVPGGTIQLLDVAGAVSAWYGAQNNSMYALDLPAIIWAGATGQSQAFPADYEQMAYARIKGATKDANLWTFTATDVLERLVTGAYKQTAKLTVALAAGGATATVESTTGWPSSGRFFIGDEAVTYSGLTATTFTGLTRGQGGTTDDKHSIGDTLNQAVLLTGNAIELCLQLMMSSGGGGSYDVLDSGAAVPEDLVDLSAFEDLVEEFEDFPFTIWVSDVSSVLDFVAKELLLPLGARLISRQGQISCRLIDTFDPTVDFLTLDETKVEPIPVLEVDADEVVNKIKIEWAWSPASDDYTKKTTYENEDSADKYGGEEEGRTPTTFKFLADIDNAATLFADMTDRLLLLYGEPLARITATAHQMTLLSQPGDDVLLEHENVPQPGAGLGHSAFMEVVSSKPDVIAGVNQLLLGYNSYSGYRMGLIAPSPLAQVPGQDPRNMDGCTLVFDPGLSLDGSLADGAAIATWTDLVSSLSLTQGTAANRPTLEKLETEGRSVARFDATNDNLNNSAVQFTDYFAEEETTIIMVVNPLAYTTSTLMWMRQSDTNRLVLQATGGNFYFDYGNALASGRISGALPGDWASNWHLVVATLDATSNLQKLTIDGVTIASGTSTDSMNNYTGTLGFGTPGTPVGADIAYCAVFNRHITDAELAEVTAWVTDRFLNATYAYAQDEFEVEEGEGKFYRAGFKVKLWREGEYMADAVNTIEAVVGDILTFEDDWETPIDSKVRLKFADYDDCATLQKQMYAFIAGSEPDALKVDDGAGNFADVIVDVDGTTAALTVDNVGVGDAFADGRDPYQIVP